MSFKAKKQGVGKKIRAKPVPVLRNAAHSLLFAPINCAAYILKVKGEGVLCGATGAALASVR